MNKTVTVNLGGSIFNIEEEAFQLLRSYLDRIKLNFVGDPGQSEIMTDIEVRLAELLSERLDEVRNVVIRSHVEEVIAVMGQPEDFAMEEGAGGTENAQSDFRHKRRRIYRDREDAAIGGVCAGLSYYFGWDPIVLRIIFVFFGIISAGTAVFAYLILWAIIPEARTTAEKLQMRGEPVTVESISRFINEEARKAAENVNSWGRDPMAGSGRGRRQPDAVFHGIGAAFTKVIGALMAFGGLVLLGILVSLFAFAEVNMFGSSDYTLREVGAMVLGDSGSYWMVTSGTALMLGIPAITLLYGGFRLLLGSTRRIPGLGWSLGLLFLTGIILTSVGGIRIGREFSADAELREQRELPLKGDTLHIRVIPDSVFIGRTHDDRQDFFELIHTQGDTRWYGEPVELDIQEADGPNCEVRITRSSRGAGKRMAGEYATHVNYSWSFENDTLDLASWFTTPEADPIRGQEVEITVFVPRGQTVSFGESVGLIWWDNDLSGQVRVRSEDGWLIPGETAAADTAASRIVIE
jgi:phage shock protein PspC (stress-responsive transcriptional regulator)